MKTVSQAFEFPAGLLAQVEAVAQEEHRAPDELVREAVERYLDERRWQRVLAFGQEQARTSDLTEEDLPRLIAESREEARRGR